MKWSIRAMTVTVWTLIFTCHCEEVDQMQESARDVCIHIAAHLEAEVNSIDENQKFNLRVKALEKFSNTELLAVAADKDCPYLARRLANGAVVNRTIPTSTQRQSPPIHTKESVLKQYGNVSFLPAVEYGLILSATDYAYSFELLDTIKSEESIQFLELFYIWKPKRLRTIREKSAVRRLIVRSINGFHTVQALKSLCRLWLDGAQSIEDRCELLVTVAKDDVWTPVIANLSTDSRAELKIFLDALDTDAKEHK